MIHRFGTDGVRGIAGVDLTAAAALGLASAAAAVIGQTEHSQKLRAIIGRDPRPSGSMLEAAVAAGLLAAGVDVTLIGIIPTPAIAYIVDAGKYDFGIMISASHNPMPDNGIKFFGPGGIKFDDAIEAKIEQVWESQGTNTPPLSGEEIGTLVDDPNAAQMYTQHLLRAWTDFSSLAQHNATLNSPNTLQKNLTIVLDCANGAASIIAPEIFRRTGANVIPLFTDLSGIEINDQCGSTSLAALTQATLEHQADLGIAFDGDADRCLAIDAQGQPIDGDNILAILALALAQHGKLQKNTIVATVMSNLGLIQRLQSAGITVITTDVGDKYVLEEILSHGYSLGGEQSGHIILSEYAKTGDGILTALALLAQLTSMTSQDFSSVVRKLPQVLVNVPVENKEKILSNQTVTRELAKINTQIADRGRILLRPSGTEELFRIMVESNNAAEAESIAQHLASIITQQLL